MVESIRRNLAETDQMVCVRPGSDMFSGGPIFAMRMLVAGVAVRFNGRGPPFQSMGDRGLAKLGACLSSSNSPSLCLTGSQLSRISWACCSAFSQERVFADTVVAFPSLNR